jgi:2'-5' RNA ligase
MPEPGRTPPVGYVTLLFGSEAEERVRVHQARVASLADAEPLAYRPHVTLTGHRMEAERIGAAMADVASGTAPFPLRLHHVGVFPENRVVFLAPRVTDQLLRLRAALLARLGAPANPFFAPDQWSPHCTIAASLSQDQLGPAAAQVIDSWEAIETTAVALGLVVEPDTWDTTVAPFDPDRTTGRRD